VSRNRAISAASGEFVTGLDDDDYFLENRISTFLGAWGKKQDNTVALYSNSCFLKAGGKKRKTKRRIKVVRENLFERNHIGNQIFVRTESIRAIAGFDEALPAWQDYDCWFRILKDPNQQMELTPQVNYVIDISHTYDRIGMTARAKKLDAFNIIVKKLNISGKRLASMRVVMFDSAKISPSFRLIFLKSMLSWSASNVFLAQKVLLKSKINKWPKYSELFNAPENPGI
jgi:glycosyltransferase involved in cell wall biosynthesis